jgi:hypothetical protein
LLNEANIDSFERICHNIALAAAPGLCRAFDVGFSPWIYSHRVAVKSASEAFLYTIDPWTYIVPVGLFIWLWDNTPDSMVHGDFRLTLDIQRLSAMPAIICNAEATKKHHRRPNIPYPCPSRRVAYCGRGFGMLVRFTVQPCIVLRAPKVLR